MIPIAAITSVGTSLSSACEGICFFFRAVILSEDALDNARRVEQICCCCV